MQEHLLEVVSIDNVNHSTKKTIMFRLINKIGNREIQTNRTAIRDIFPNEKFEIKDSCGLFLSNEFVYHHIEVNDKYYGNILSFETTPYYKNGKTNSTYKGAFFDGENFLFLAAKDLANYNSAPLDQDGNPIIFDNLEEIKNHPQNDTSKIIDILAESEEKNSVSQFSIQSFIVNLFICLAIIFVVYVALIKLVIPLALSITSTIILFFIFAVILVIAMLLLNFFSSKKK